jgi:hypothetical protein
MYPSTGQLLSLPLSLPLLLLLLLLSLLPLLVSRLNQPKRSGAPSSPRPYRG